MALPRAEKPFRFYTRLHLSELTALRANNLKQLSELIKKVPGSCIYHHTHRFLQQHQYLSPEPPNDFAYWVREVLGESDLGERLFSLDTIQFTSIRALRNKIAEIIGGYIQHHPSAQLKFAQEGEEFHFVKSKSFILPTSYSAYTLQKFIEILKKITIDSIYFHIFEARLRLQKRTNDFSNWIEHSFGDKALADEIARLDPYTYTMEDLRQKIITIINRKLST
jgi:hypothetical protein